MATVSTNSSIPASPTTFLDKGGKVSQPWFNYLSRLLRQPGPAFDVPVTTASPFSYTAPQNGTIYFAGGTISDISLTRSGVTFSTGALIGGVNMANGDTVTVTFGAQPTITFVPG